MALGKVESCSPREVSVLGKQIISKLIINDDEKILSEVSLDPVFYLNGNVDRLLVPSRVTVGEKAIVVNLSGADVTGAHVTLIVFTILNLLGSERYKLKEIGLGTISALQLNDTLSKKIISYKGSLVQWALNENTFSRNSQFIIPWDCNDTQVTVFNGETGLWKLSVEKDEVTDIIRLGRDKVEFSDNTLTLPCKMGNLKFNINELTLYNDREFNDFISKSIYSLFTKQYRY